MPPTDDTSFIVIIVVAVLIFLLICFAPCLVFLVLYCCVRRMRHPPNPPAPLPQFVSMAQQPPPGFSQPNVAPSAYYGNDQRVFYDNRIPPAIYPHEDVECPPYEP
ncbi:hypothetical protein RF11_05845 [Thelohanellus kitauei]|uniref:Uncharacterized protein n=1 Tax=Thelohanellus kitauei TaxID=669202 RepID=A0A0C2M262_THEKT|nr:hypothetical protein RF11_05845 [Thelohanellus kitauei]